MLPSKTETGNETETQEAPVTSPHGLAALFVVGGLIGLIAAVVLLVEKMTLAANPDYIPSCNVNPVLSCGSVMATPQAAAFGVPNPIIGVAGFAIVAAIGVGLLAGGRYTAWYWATIQIGVTFAVIFVHWLIYQSLYVIGALCPYCMAVWAVTIPIFWYASTRNLRSLSKETKWITALNEYRGAILTGWYLLIIVLIANRFWDYWSTLV
ncbi:MULTISPECIES: vitamin K epoxide reductase family protein [Brevibacterium]|uniref:Vitamin K epoxide reductase n=2 Tax=Brevibacterium TaxID=1696 RepID=A0A144MEJ2_BRELN|nr:MULTISPECIES: vitamin K epoxide reductase family protein [Brevibacterium]AMT94950.1 vitamin K epoxide reductase [Brevibacterium linens]UVI35720.1 vitamin K epoxide reductase family protein [Brevibacterium spongiae]